MRELSLRLIFCARVATGSDEIIRLAAVKRFYAARGREPASDEEIAAVASEVDASIIHRDQCAGIPAELAAQRVGWLEKAARAGDTQARIDYARFGLQDMDRDDILMQPDEVQRRREVAGEQLQHALESGDCDALNVLSDAYSGHRGRVDWIYQANPTLAAAYASAARMYDSAYASAEEAAVSALDTAQRAAAERQGAALYTRYCRGRLGT